MLYYEYLNSHYRLIEVDLSGQSIRCWAKNNKQVEFIEKLRNNDDENAEGAQSIYVCVISFRKSKKNRLKLSQENLTAL